MKSPYLFDYVSCNFSLSWSTAFIEISLWQISTKESLWQWKCPMSCLLMPIISPFTKNFGLEDDQNSLSFFFLSSVKTIPLFIDFLFFWFHTLLYCCLLTVVCIFSRPLPPTPSKPTSLPSFHLLGDPSQFNLEQSNWGSLVQIFSFIIHKTHEFIQKVMTMWEEYRLIGWREHQENSDGVRTSLMADI